MISNADSQKILRRAFGFFLFSILFSISGCLSHRVLSSINVFPSEQAPRKVYVEAMNYRFEPKVIKVHQGEIIELYIESHQGVHGFASKDLGINKTIRPNEPVTILFKAEKRGKAKFHCSHFCGWGHLFMRGAIIVEP